MIFINIYFFLILNFPRISGINTSSSLSFTLVTMCRIDLGASWWAPAPGFHLVGIRPFFPGPGGGRGVVGGQGWSRCEALNSRGSGPHRSPWQQSDDLRIWQTRICVPVMWLSVLPPRTPLVCQCWGTLRKETTSVLKESCSLGI